MLKKLRPSALLFLILGISCSKKQRFDNPIDAVLQSSDPDIRMVMDHIEDHEVQIRYTVIDRKNDRVFFTEYDYGVNPKHYFYPASTVKFPIALLALEKLNEDPGLDLNSRFYVEGDSIETSFAEAISNIFAVSDNASYNRLFEYLDQDRINQELRKKGIRPVRISHRLSTPEAEEITTKPLIVYINDSTTTMYGNTINTSAEELRLEGIQKGKGFYKEGTLHQEPFHFGLKNYYPITAQHDLLKRVFFPEKYPPDAQFSINRSQREFLLRAMHTLPRELGYSPKDYPDNYVKFFMYGDSPKTIPPHLKIYNKIGLAYGTLTDCAYIVDTKNNLEFLLTATILVNKNGIFNDNMYEYDTIGIPFLAALGRGIHQHQMNHKP